MDPLLAELQAHLDALDARSLRRHLRPLPATGPRVQIAGQSLINLASNDYLGLSQHPRLKAAACQAIEQHGTGAGASRLVSGHLELHAQVERQFAELKHPGAAQAAPPVAALLLPTGYMANLAALTALAGPGDLICLDKLVHASLIDAARATGAELRTYPHLQTDKLERLLARHHADVQAPATHLAQARPPRRFIVTDTVFSMDGDVANLPALCDLAERHRAMLVVDEAHATGLLGPRGSGLCEAQGVVDRVHVVVSTASKGLGSLGGIVTAAQPIIDTLVNHARALIYTTAVPPAQAAAIGAALDVVATEPARRERVMGMAAHVRSELTKLGWSLPATRVPMPILPLVVGDAARALHLADHLQRHGLLAVAIRPPTVAPGSARVRLTLRADLDDADLDQLFGALHSFGGSPG